MSGSGSALSLRDPDGQLIALGGRLFRLVHRSASDFYERILQQGAVRELSDKGVLVPWSKVDLGDVPSSIWEAARLDRDQTGLVLEHPSVWFASYPTEWPAPMLHAAGQATLALFTELQKQGLGLKDASPYNILFEGPRPVFCDVLSIEQRPSRLATWAAVGQFLRCFIHPLIAFQTGKALPHEIFWLNRDGIETDALAPLLGWRRWTPSLFFAVTLPTWLHRRWKGNQPAAPDRLYSGVTCDSQEKADFILNHVIHRLQNRLKKLQPKGRNTAWTGYMESEYSFTQSQLGEKEQFVSQWMESNHPKTVLDVGCNTGHFSRIAAHKGARVVAIDYDPQVVGQVWEMARANHLDIQPLVVNFSRPTPSLGWRNGESRSFLDRAQGKFEGVMFLATLHHLTLTDGIPLSEVLELASRLVTRSCLMEFIGPEDRAFKDLCRGRDFSHLTQEAFEAAASKHFRIRSQHRLSDSHRTLYALEPLTSR